MRKYRVVNLPRATADEWEALAGKWGWRLQELIFFAVTAFVEELPESPLAYRPKVREDLLTRPPSMDELREQARRIQEAQRERYE